MGNNEPQEEYFVMQYLNYDGWYISKYKTYEEAKHDYDSLIAFDKQLPKYPDTKDNLPVFLIKGQILEHIGEF